MQDKVFWQIINDANRTGDIISHKVKKIKNTILELGDDYIAPFYLEMDKQAQLAYDSALWSAAELIKGGCGDDCFNDFRYWLILKGKSTFEKALKDPDYLVGEITDVDLEQGLDGFQVIVMLQGMLEERSINLGKTSFTSRKTMPVEEIDFSSFPELQKRFGGIRNYPFEQTETYLKKLLSKDQAIRYQAEEALINRQDYNCVPELLEILRKSSGLQVKISVISILQSYKAEIAVNPLIKIATNKWKSIDLRLHAIVALGEINSSEAIDVLKSLAENKNTQIRDYSIGALIRLYNNSAGIVKETSLVALTQIKNGKLVDFFLESLNEKQGKLRGIIVDALGQYKLNVVHQELKKVLLRDADPNVRGSAAHALVTISGKEAIYELERAINYEKDCGVKQVIEQAMARVK